jgi:REP element-mobilizing transposase RayT
MSRDRYKIFEDRHPHFLTSTVVNWLPIFGSPLIAQIVLDSLQFLQQHERLIVYAYVILENHLHLIASADNLSKEIANFRSYTARQIIDFYIARNAQHILKQLNYYKLRHKTDRDYQLWQEGTHPEQIQGEAMMRQKIEYIHYNPVKRGYVDDPTHWRYSSARNYAGQEGLLEVQTEW